MTETDADSFVPFENGLSGEQLALLEARLRAERETLSRRLTLRRRRLADVPSREIDDADWAADSAAQSLAVRLVDRDAKMLHEIEAALRRLAEGAYGVCARTSEPIGFERLAARPWTRFAVAAKEEVERDRAGATALGGVKLDAEQESPDVDDQDRAA